MSECPTCARHTEERDHYRMKYFDIQHNIQQLEADNKRLEWQCEKLRHRADSAVFELSTPLQAIGKLNATIATMREVLMAVSRKIDTVDGCSDPALATRVATALQSDAGSRAASGALAASPEWRGSADADSKRLLEELTVLRELAAWVRLVLYHIDDHFHTEQEEIELCLDRLGEIRKGES